MRVLFSGLTKGHESEFTTWPTLTRSIRKANSRNRDSVMAVSCATRPPKLLQLKRKEIAESNRNRSELRVHRVHESDMGCAGCLRGLWLNRKSLHCRHCGSGVLRSGLDREILPPPRIPLL